MSQIVLTFLDNAVLAWGLAACGLAQLSKLFIELLVHRRWRPAVLIETGGMPSSHSALVTGTAAAIAWEQGLDSPLFALAATVAFVVMYDASGVRRAAGRIAERVNGLPQAEGLPPLKTSLGHSRLEVLVGSLMGPLIALLGEALVGSPLQLAQNFGLLVGVA
ncbi:MAG: divergent PAP2 family protein [Synechococcus sp.]|nr:divergent PAP2 family protein [Synechococcus sp.]